MASHRKRLTGTGDAWMLDAVGVVTSAELLTALHLYALGEAQVGQRGEWSCVWGLGEKMRRQKGMEPAGA
jgi:hypothetical protein